MYFSLAMQNGIHVYNYYYTGEFGIVYRGLLTEWDKKKTEPTVGSVAVKTLRGNNNPVGVLFLATSSVRRHDCTEYNYYLR